MVVSGSSSFTEFSWKGRTMVKVEVGGEGTGSSICNK